MNTNKESRGSAENFVVFGTAFPETTEKDRRAGRSDAGQFVPVWKQEARDEKGRRRFHGAFTGGFSAGYFNTVGSKEGWEPSNYVSSRTARNERKEARPEDFMDEEDLEAMAGARKLVATEEFDILGGTERELAARRKQQQEEEERGGGLSFLGTSLIDMFGPPKDSIGVKLLRKMGWRPGQGIGPRMKRRLSDSDDEEDAFGQDITFAPRDTPIENFQTKRDAYGLGYDLSASVPEVAEMKRLRELARQKAVGTDAKNRASFGIVDKSGRKTEAFGLGAYEVDDEDEDVYRNESSMTNYHSALYDDNEGGLTQDELRRQSMKRKRQEDQDIVLKNSLKCSDGRPPLKGFHVSDQKQEIGRWHAPPKVPADYTGQHIIVADTNTPKAAAINNESIFSFEERGNVLGEKPIEQRSVFDYMPKHSKDKLDQAVGWFIDRGKDKSQLSEFPTVPKDAAQLALKGFMPFGDQLQKQARYRNYLENQAGLLSDDGVPKNVLPIPEGLTYEAGMKEMDEFAKAARIFRPISAMMSGRFTSASETKHVEVVSFEGGLKTEEQYRKEKEQRAKEALEPETSKELTQEAEAAAMKMFGNLTRTVKPFYPNRLVCKRFNVRNPHPDHDPTTDKAAGRTQAGSKDALSKESMESMLNERMPLTFTSSSKTPEPLSLSTDDPMMKAVVPKPSERTADQKDTKAPTTGVDVIKKDEDEDEGGPPLDYERPSMDIFKAIFDDSDSEDEEEEEEKQEIKQEIKEESKMVITAPSIDNQDDFIGPPAPPQASTADIPMAIVKDTSSNTETPFRPMFKRASERKESSNPLTHVISEEVVVQPFKPRSSGHKRRHVSVSEDEDEEDYKKTKTSSSRRSERDKDEDRQSRHHHHKHKSSKHKRSKSRDRSKSRERSSRHKSSSSRRDRKSSHKKRDKEDEQDEYEGMWVEKEPPVVIQTTTGHRKKEGRMSAADMW